MACAFPWICWAQARPPVAPASAARPAAPASSAAIAASAMERVQRAADSPMRAILEAAKLRRRIEGDAPGDSEAARRANPPRAAAAEAVRAEAPRSVATTPPVRPANGASAPVSANGAAVADAAAAPDPPVITIRTLPSEAMPAAPARSGELTPTAVAPLRPASAAVVPAELPRPAPLPTAAAATAAPRAPELTHMVEPEMTPRLQLLLVRPEVVVEFTIQPDGSVSGVRVLPPVPRALVPVIAEAVEQWRYAPVPAARPHRVQLVFKADGN